MMLQKYFFSKIPTNLFAPVTHQLYDALGNTIGHSNLWYTNGTQLKTINTKALNFKLLRFRFLINKSVWSFFKLNCKLNFQFSAYSWVIFSNSIRLSSSQPIPTESKKKECQPGLKNLVYVNQTYTFDLLTKLHSFHHHCKPQIYLSAI